MHFFLHGLIAICCLVTAGAVAVLLSRHWPGLAPAYVPVMAVAVVVAIAGAAGFARQARRMGLVTGDLAATRRACDGLARDLDRLAATVAHLQGSQPPEDESRISRVVAEVRILQGLIERSHFNDTRSGDTPAARPAEPAAAHEAPVPVADSVPDPVPESATASEMEIRRLLREGLRADRVEVFVQPIVSLPQRKKRFFECYTRIKDDNDRLLVPEQYLDTARDDRLLSAIDNLLLFRTVQLIRRERRTRRGDMLYFCNVASESLKDTAFFADFVEFVADNRSLAANLVFEFRQDDLERADGIMLDKLQQLSALGFRFSLDSVRHINFDLVSLARDKVRFIKIEAHRMTEHLEIEGGEQDLLRLKRSLDRAGIDLIVEKIETEKQLVELLDLDIDYGEGYLFGEPHPTGPHLTRDEKTGQAA